MPRRIIPDHRQDTIINRDYQIDWSNPLTDNLLFCAYCGGQDRVELIGQTEGTLLASGSWWGNSVAGNAFDSANTNTGGVHWPHGGRLTAITTKYSVYILADIDSMENYSVLFSIPVNAGWTASYGSLAWYRNVDSLKLTHMYATTSSLFTEKGGIEDILVTGLKGYGLTRNGTFLRYFSNGSFEEAIAATSDSVYWPATNRDVCIFNHHYADPDEGMDGRALCLMIWGRALADDEMALIHGDHRRILKPRKRRNFFIPTVPAAEEHFWTMTA